MIALFSLPLFLLVTSHQSLATAAEDSAWEVLARIPVQHEGRVKPFESFANEAAIELTGTKTYEGLSAVALVWDWMASPDKWNTKAMIPVAYRPLREEFKAMLINKRLSPEIIMQHEPFISLVSQAFEKQKVKEKMTQLERERISLYTKANLFQQIAAGAVPNWIAHPKDPSIGWLAFNEFGSAEGQQLLSTIYPPTETAAVNQGIKDLLLAIAETDTQTEIAAAAKEFESSLQNLFASRNVSMNEKVLNAEMTYNKLHPFGWAWKIYLFAALLLVFVSWGVGAGSPSPGKPLQKILIGGPVLILFTGFLMHTYGFYLRCVISGRPPVTNMYESIVWVSWAAILFALILFAFYRAPLIPITAAIVGALAQLVADSFPAVLKPEISPLVPVLRSNLWLTVHVLTITLSYGAFALAWGLGHVVIFKYMREPDKPNKHRTVSQFVYRAVQIGVILLAAGTVLGGVWANYSWGRFWGWDPKETWALIALIGYLIVLHGRFSGWFGIFGTAVGSVIAFLGVVMAWYGVNFVLAAGLHSYGFGGGGAPYVLTVALFDLLIILFFVYRYQSKKKQISS